MFSSSGKMAGRRHYRLLPLDRVENMVFPVLDFEDELTREGLMVFFAQHLVAGREIGAFLYFEGFERGNQLWRVFASLKMRFLDPELKRVDRLEVGLHVTVGERPRGVDLFQAGERLVIESVQVRRVERLVEHRQIAVDADKSLDLLAQRRQLGRGGDGAVAGKFVFLGEPKVIALIDKVDRIRAKENKKQAVEISTDLRQEGRHVGGAEWYAERADDLAAILLDAGRIGVTGRLAPGVVGISDVPALAELIYQVRGKRLRLRRREVEAAEHVTAAFAGGQGRVEADPDHVDDLVFF